MKVMIIIRIVTAAGMLLALALTTYGGTGQMG